MRAAHEGALKSFMAQLSEAQRASIEEALDLRQEKRERDGGRPKDVGERKGREPGDRPERGPKKEKAGKGGGVQGNAEEY